MSDHYQNLVARQELVEPPSSLFSQPIIIAIIMGSILMLTLLSIGIYYVIRYRRKKRTSRTIKKSKIVYEMNADEDMEESRIYYDNVDEKYKDIVIPPQTSPTAEWRTYSGIDPKDSKSSLDDQQPNKWHYNHYSLFT